MSGHKKPTADIRLMPPHGSGGFGEADGSFDDAPQAASNGGGRGELPNFTYSVVCYPLAIAFDQSRIS